MKNNRDLTGGQPRRLTLADVIAESGAAAVSMRIDELVRNGQLRAVAAISDEFALLSYAARHHRA